MKYISTSDFSKTSVSQSIRLYRIYKLDNTVMFVNLLVSEALDLGAFYLEATFGEIWSKNELYQKVKEDLLDDLNYNEPANRREKYLKLDIPELNKQVVDLIIKEDGLVESANSEYYRVHKFTDEFYGFSYTEVDSCWIYGDTKNHTPTTTTSYGYKDQEREKDFKRLKTIFPDIDFYRNYESIFKQMVYISTRLETDKIYLELVSSVDAMRDDLESI